MPEADIIAIVTGGSRGLGRATVEALARRGVSSILTYHTNRSAADEVVDSVEQSGARAVALQLDTGDTHVFPAFADEIRRVLREWGAERFNYLVNMAGTSHSGLFGEVTEEDFDAAYRVHAKGPFFLTQTLLPLIANGGRIVNISSGLTRFAYPGRIAYAAMKGAVEVMTHYMAKELGSRRIAVNTVAPGAIQTDFFCGYRPLCKSFLTHIDV
ncbi:SDR family NAD(P)-dependent oxidoreductase [Acetobacter senegalensis]|uniref:SDR family NAD(P)-dependent oxidoreductase n=1 Tax=Acetobacter senegalensis TaxID=446692 RepID=UPI001EDADFAC